MDYYDTILPRHPIIPIPYTLSRLVFSPSHGVLAHFTLHLQHQPLVTSHPLMSMVAPSPFASLCLVSCMQSSLCNKGKISLSPINMFCSQTIISYKGCNASRIIRFPHPSYIWTQITSMDIINAFHLGLPHLSSYHCIRYALHVQCALLCLICMIINPFNIAT